MTAVCEWIKAVGASYGTSFIPNVSQKCQEDESVEYFGYCK